MEETTNEGRKLLEHEEIARSNNLITARYKATLTENKMTVLALKRSTFDDHGRHVASFTASELKKIMGHSNGSFYQQLKDTAKKMQNRQLAIEDVESKKFRFMSIIDTAEFDNGIFTVSFNPDVNKYIDNLKNSFTIMNMGILVDFTSTYAYRLYEILKAQEYLIDTKGDENGELCSYYSVAELKVSVGCVDTSTQAVQKEMGRKTPDYEKIVDELAGEKHFEKWYDFKKNVLDVAERQINDKSDIHMRYELVRSGRGGKVKGVSIYISHNAAYQGARGKNPEIKISENISVVNEPENIKGRVDMIIDYIDEYDVSRSEARVFLEKANYNVERVKDAYNYILTKRNVKDFVSYMIDAIIHGYAAEEPIYKASLAQGQRNNSTRNHLVVEEGSQISFADLEMDDATGTPPVGESNIEKAEKQNTMNEAPKEDGSSADMAMDIINGMKNDEIWKKFINQLELPFDLILQVKGAKWLLWQFSSWKDENKTE